MTELISGKFSYDNLGICDENENGATYEFGSLAGYPYYISVFPRQGSGDGGEFAIQLTSSSAPANDNYVNNVPVYINSDFVVGTTVNATLQRAANDVWYTFTGNGNRVQVTTCSDDTTTAHDLMFTRFPSTNNNNFGSTTSNNNMCDEHFEAAVYELDSTSGYVYYSCHAKI